MEFGNNPRQQFDSCAAFTESTTVNDVACYLFSIGDRHSQNMHVDDKPSENINVDFGRVLLLNGENENEEQIPF